MPRTPSSLPRRSLLLGCLGTGAVVVTGCGTRQREATAGAVEPTAPASAADSGLVEQVGAQVAAALATARATARRHGALRPVAQPFADLHLAHLEHLDAGTDATDGAGGTTPAHRAAALAALLRTEERLQRALMTAALQAESGALAQVFASMAAAIAQRRAVAA